MGFRTLFEPSSGAATFGGAKRPSHSSQHQLFCEADRSVLGCAACFAADLVQKAGHRGSNQEMQ